MGRERLGNAEIGHHHPAASPLQQDVVRLDVTVDDRQSVGGAQGIGGFPHDPAHLLGRHPAAAADPGRQ